MPGDHCPHFHSRGFGWHIDCLRRDGLCKGLLCVANRKVAVPEVDHTNGLQSIGALTGIKVKRRAHCPAFTVGFTKHFQISIPGEQRRQVADIYSPFPCAAVRGDVANELVGLAIFVVEANGCKPVPRIEAAGRWRERQCQDCASGFARIAWECYFLANGVAGCIINHLVNRQHTH